jgi:hypothetical protein
MVEEISGRRDLYSKVLQPIEASFRRIHGQKFSLCRKLTLWDRHAPFGQRLQVRWKRFVLA